MLSIVPNYWAERLLNTLLACGDDQELVIRMVSDLLPPDEIDRMYSGGTLQETHRLLYALVIFFRDKKKEAKARGVKTFYGN